MRQYSLVLVLLSLSTLSVAQTQFGEWRTYGGNLSSNKYSALEQINGDNFNNLEIAWRWKSVDSWLSKTVSNGEWWVNSEQVFNDLQDENPKRWRGGVPPRLAGLKVTPLMVNEILYVTTALYQAAAIDAKTGETLWVFNPKMYEAGTPTMSIYWQHRGPAYWTDGDEEERIYWGTGAGWLYAVDAKTGRPCADFGENGRVDLTAQIPRANREDRDYLNAMTYSCASPPLVVDDVIVTGASIADRRVVKEAPPGWVQAFDVKTGKPKWIFKTIPEAGEFGNETWENDSWKYSGNSNVWSQMSADPELGLIYLPTGTPTNDFYGGHRLGDNLFAESIICVRADTGERVWHFQTVHHGVWDYDNPAAPNLLDITVDGKPVKAVAQISKQGFIYTFDRVTGKPIWPIEERAVDTLTDLPGERLSPTQPFPTKPAAFEYQGVTEDDVIDFTP
jgi:quinoprotein glucose dehydrogenase